MNDLELVNIIIKLMKFIENSGLMLDCETTKQITEIFERRLSNVRL